MTTTSETGPWDAAAFDRLERWAPAMSAALEKVTNDPWNGALDRKTVELVCVAFNARARTSTRMGRASIFVRRSRPERRGMSS